MKKLNELTDHQLSLLFFSVCWFEDCSFYLEQPEREEQEKLMHKYFLLINDEIRRRRLLIDCPKIEEIDWQME